MRLSRLYTLLGIGLLLGLTSHAQSTFYDIGTLQKVQVYFSPSNWDYMLDTAKAGADSYILADSVRINGVLYDSVGVKYKGNSSYNASYVKNPLHIALSEYKDQAYQGYTDVKLGNGYADPSMIREPLSYAILSNYMDCPKANFAQLYINGAYTGLYSNVESINKQFCSDHFYSSKNTLIKCNPVVNPSPSNKSNLKYITGADSSGYFNYYEVKSNYGWNDLKALCDTVTNYPASLGTSLDMDRVIWMLAYNNVLVNLDSYCGVFSQNYYLYKDKTHHFNPVIWDLNMSLGGFPYLGSSNTSMGSLSIANMQQLQPTIHATDAYWPLIKNTLANAMYKRMYIAHMRTITNEMFASASYTTLASQMQGVIDTAVLADTNKFYSYPQFQNGMTANVSVGSYSVPGISTLMTARNSFLQSTTEFSYTPPTIITNTASVPTPSLGATVVLTATVTNALSSAVYLGYRLDQESKFTRILMYDDGAHNDGASGDNVFGVSITMDGFALHYYFYAENTNAGMFSPQRAEHEFYVLHANVNAAAPGQVVINEFMASNLNSATDETGQHEDWIELYNRSNVSLSLYSLYLTDNYANPTKFAFPKTAMIPANGYLIIWADEDASTSTDIHCNFKLSGSGEELMLSNSEGTVLDSVAFGALASDHTMGRCPNGTGSFIDYSTPTFSVQNTCLASVQEAGKLINLLVYPNPANETLHIRDNGQAPLLVEIRDAFGHLVYQGSLIGALDLQTADWASGVYCLKVSGLARKFIISR